MKLHLGVADFPYVNRASATAEPVRKGKKRGGSRWRRRDIIGGDVSTTGDVAQILERRYHVMEIFFEEKQDQIAAALTQSYAGALESVAMGAPISSFKPDGRAMEVIQTMFRKFISEGEMERLGYPGVPTKAAQRGVNHRMKHPYAKRAPRPSFRDTGLYEASMRAWLED